jgi:hypothetical protein
MEIFMMDNGLMVSKTDEEFILKQALVHIIVDNGKMVKEMVMVFLNFLVINSIKVLFQNQ